MTTNPIGLTKKQPPGGGDRPRTESLGIRRTVGLVSIIFLSEMAAGVYVLSATALPEIASHYQTDQAGWAMTIPILSAVVMFCLIGKLADLRGKRLLLVILASTAALGAIISALAPTFAIFLIGRALQGMLNVAPALAYSLIRDVFPKRAVAFATAITFTGAGVGLGLSPAVAGWLINAFGALSIFWFIGIYLIVCIIVLIITIPESPLRIQSKLDWMGVILIGIGGAALLYGLGEGTSRGWGSPVIIGLFAIGVASFVAWYWWNKRAEVPLINPQLLRSKPMWTTMLATIFVFALFGPIPSIVPMMLQTPATPEGGFSLDISASQVVYFMGPMGIGMVLGGVIVGAGARRWGVRTPMFIAFALMGVSCVGLALARDSVGEVLLWVVIYGLGMGAAYGAYPNLVLQAAPPESQGIAATMVAVFGNLGTGVMVQLSFVFLYAKVIPGTSGEYGADGYTLAFLVTAPFAVLGMIATFILPHGRRRDVIEMRAGEEVAAKLATT